MIRMKRMVRCIRLTGPFFLLFLSSRRAVSVIDSLSRRGGSLICRKVDMLAAAYDGAATFRSLAVSYKSMFFPAG